MQYSMISESADLPVEDRPVMMFRPSTLNCRSRRRRQVAEDFAGLVRHVIENEYLNGETIRLDGALHMGPR